MGFRLMGERLFHQTTRCGADPQKCDWPHRLGNELVDDVIIDGGCLTSLEIQGAIRGSM
jgi:hypothetical protein